MSFFEDYFSKEIDTNEEIINIEFILNTSGLYGYINNNFLKWNCRKGAPTLSKFEQQSGITAILERAKKSYYQVKLFDFLHYIEYIVTLTTFYYEDLRIKNEQALLAVFDNIKNILDKINYQIKWSCDSPRYAYCIEKDFKVREAAEIVNDENLAEKIFKYRHYSLDGNLYEKAIILSRLYMYFEGIKTKLKTNNFGNLESIVSNLSDKLNVRHKPTKNEELVINGFTKEELEKAYDSLFDAYITGIILEKYINQKPYLDELAKKFVEGK